MPKLYSLCKKLYKKLHICAKTLFILARMCQNFIHYIKKCTYVLKLYSFLHVRAKTLFNIAKTLFILARMCQNFIHYIKNARMCQNFIHYIKNARTCQNFIIDNLIKYKNYTCMSKLC